MELWLLPTFSVVIVLVGAAIGATMCALMRVHARHAPVVICCCACGNALALPLSISQALAVNVDWIRASENDGGPSLITYVFVYTVTDAMILFGPVYFVLGWQPATPQLDVRVSTMDGIANDESSEGIRLIEGGGQHGGAADTQKARAASDGSVTVTRQLASSCANPMMVASIVSVALSVIGQSHWVVLALSCTIFS